MDDSILPRSIILLIFLGFSAFFAACEAAYFSLSQLQLAHLKENRGRRGRIVNTLLEHPRRLLITIYIGNELVNIAISALATSIAIKVFGSIGVGIAIGVGTFLILVFGEISPKTLSLKYAESAALLAAYPLKLFSNIVQPIQVLFTRLAEKVITSLGMRVSHDNNNVMTDEEFRTMVQLGEGEGIIAAEEREMIHNVIEFGETTVSDIMVPKVDMFTLHIDDTLDEIIPKIMENFYSRVPVYDKDEETAMGILFTKDLNRSKHLPKEKFHLKSILHTPIVVPKSKMIKELLQEFKKLKRHMAIVLDEYGSLAGLVTLEDILEELVGEIDSEMRKEEKPMIKIDENNYRVTGTFSILEFNENFETPISADEYNTVGGFVFGLFGRIPRSGEIVTHENFKFQVEKMKGSRILKIHVTHLNGASHTGKTKKKEDT